MKSAEEALLWALSADGLLGEDDFLDFGDASPHGR